MVAAARDLAAELVAPTHRAPIVGLEEGYVPGPCPFPSTGASRWPFSRPRWSRADRLGAALGMEPGALWVKRDDVTGLGGGGNKARKLDYLCADALEQGADMLVTGGGPQSNHVRMTAAAANLLGLDCAVVMAGLRPETSAGNVLLIEILGADLRGPALREGMDYDEIEAAIDDLADRLEAAGRRPYRIPIGGATAVGELGYVRAAAELRDQAATQFGEIELVVVAAGSGGTHAGLAAGLGDLDLVLGVDVGARTDLDTAIPAKAAEAAALAGLPAPAGTVRVDHDRVGAATAPRRRSAGGPCSSPPARRTAPRSRVHREGPRRPDRSPRGRSVRPDTRTVFMHTGGLPALFAPRYATWGQDGAD